MKLVVDASVAVKWVVLEDGRSDALQRTAGEQLVAPDFVLAEAGNILWKKVRLKQLEAEQAKLGLAFIGNAYERLLPTGQLAERALALAVELDHPVYDCLYIANCELEQAALVTADARLARKVAERGSPELVLIGGGG